MRRTLALFLLALLLLAGQAGAAELPQELRQADPEAAELAEGGLGEGLRRLLGEALAQAREYLTAGVASAAAIMAGAALLGAAESADPTGKVGRYTSIAGALWAAAVSAGDLSALMGLGEKTIEDLSLLGKALLPVLCAAEAAGGGVGAAAAKQVAAVFFSNVLVSVIKGVLLPLVHLYIGVSVAGAVLEGGVMERIGGLLKRGVCWALGALLALYTGYLTISGAVAGAADAQAVKAAKTAVSAAVPVVGGILAEAAESVLAGAGTLRGLVGTFGTLAVAGCCLVPVARLIVQYVLYQGAALAASAAGPKKLAELLSALSEAFALVLAMTAATAVAVLIGIISTLTAVSPW